ncbi:MAG: hypothetical protein L3K08_04450 [Thermoplasmata archaeon]|nr:hypothetical protein [Thermoplasmata archaeon]
MPELRPAGAPASIAISVAFAGMLLFTVGYLIWVNSPDGSNQFDPACHCQPVGGEALAGATIGLVGILLIPLAVGISLWSLATWPRIESFPDHPEDPPST